VKLVEVTRADWPPFLERNPDMAERMDPAYLRHVCTKVCGRCRELKRLSEFHRLAASKDGRLRIAGFAARVASERRSAPKSATLELTLQ
jgi:hypothetical protein